MSFISAESGVEHGRALNVSNTRVRWDEQVELASSQNLLSNPDMADFGDEDGGPSNITLGAPPDPSGWGVLIKQIKSASGTVLRDTILTHQDTGPLDPDRETYYQKGPLVNGAPPQDISARARMAAPASFSVSIENMSENNLAAGWRSVSYGWIMSKTRGNTAMVHNSDLLTEHSAPTVTSAALLAGQAIEIPLDGLTPPEYADGLYIACSYAQASAAAAASAPQYIVKRMQVRGGLPESYTISGPMRNLEKAPSENKTSRGNVAQWGPPIHRYKRTVGKINGFYTKLSWRFKTEAGWSQAQTETNELGTHRNKDKHLGLFFRPRKRPSNASLWQPLYQEWNSKIWYAMDPRPFDKWAVLHGTDPEKNWPEGNRPEQFEKGRSQQEPDATGIEGPDAALDEITIVGVPVLPIGTYIVRVVWYDDDGNETAPSYPITREITTLGDALKVGRPMLGNMYYNSDGQEVGGAGKEKGWDYPIVAGTSVVWNVKNTLKLVDTSGDVTGAARTVAKAPWSNVPEDISTAQPYGIRARVEFKSRTSGAIQLMCETRPRPDMSQNRAPTNPTTGLLWEDLSQDPSILKEWNGSAWVTVSHTQHGTATNVARHNAGGAAILKLNILGTAGTAPETTLDGVGYIIIPNPSGKKHGQVRVLYQSFGAAGNAANYTNGEVSFLGQHAGASFPRTFRPREWAVDTDVTRSEQEEPSEFEAETVAPTTRDPFIYRRNGICKISRTVDADRHANLQTATDANYARIRAVEYWAQRGTPPADEYGMVGYWSPVDPATQYTLSCYLEHRGVSMTANALTVGEFDARGMLIRRVQTASEGHMKQGVTGDSAGSAGERLSQTFTTHADTAYIKVMRGGFSDGFWRCYAWQLRAAATAGTYKNTNELSGSRRYTFDTGVSGVPTGTQLDFLGEVRTWVQGGALYTDDQDVLDVEVPGTTPATQVTELFRSTDDDPDVVTTPAWSSWTATFSAVPRRRYWQIETFLTSTSAVQSPLVDTVGIQLIRPYTQLCRPDGKEFDVPVQVVNFPVPTFSPLRNTFLSDSNVPRTGLRGSDLGEVEGFGLETYADATVRDINTVLARGDGTVVVEDADANRRYLIWLTDPIQWTVDREENPADGLYWIHRADGLSGIVLDVETLTGNSIFS